MMKYFESIWRTGIYGILCVFVSLFFDKLLLLFILSIQTASAIMFFSYVTFLGESYSVILMGVFLSIFLIRYKKRLLPLWASLLTVFVLIFLLKIIIMRPRPFEAMETGSIVRTTLSSFPSGHSMAAFTLAYFSSTLWEKYDYGFWLLAVLISFSRIYLQVHYLSDVVAGAFLGYIIARYYMLIGDKYGWK